MARVLSDETTLSRHRKKLERENRWLRYLAWAWGALALVCLVAGGLQWHLRSGTGTLWLAAVFGFLGISHYLKPRDNTKQIDLMAAGLKGETEVARALADGLDNRYYLYNDLNVRSGFRKAQIDHVVVGPCGVVVVETKNWRGRFVGDVREKAWQQYRFNDSPPRRVGNPVLQNQRHAEVVTAALRAHGVPEVPVIPLLVMTAKKATLEIRNLREDVVWPSELCDHLRRLPVAPAADERAVDAVLGCFQRFLR